MQIACLVNPERKEILTIFCDESPWRDVHTSIFGKRPLLPQGCLSLEEFSEQFSILEYRQAKNYALRRLSMQAMLSVALERSLKERLISGKTLHRLISELTDLGAINDEEWTASFVRSQTKKKVGPRAIAQKLASKGVRGEKLEMALEKTWNSQEQKDLILQLLATRYVRKNLLDFKERQKIIASLVRRGFDLSMILDCLAEKARVS